MRTFPGVAATAAVALAAPGLACGAASGGTTDTRVGVAAGAPGARWGPVETVAHPVRPSRPGIVVGPAGTATMVWRGSGWVVASRRPPGGDWGPRVRLGRGFRPEVGVDGTGTLTVAWSRQPAGFGPQVMTARRRVGASWERAVPLSPAISSGISSGRGAFQPDLSVGRGGAVVVTWLWGQEDSGASRVQVRSRRSGGSWGAVETLSPADVHSPVNAVDASGKAVVLWVVGGDVISVHRPADRWSAPRRVGVHAEPAQLAMDDAGDAVAVWAQVTATSGYQAQGATRPVGGPWDSPSYLQPVQSPPTDSGEPVVAADNHNGATAAWGLPDGRVMAATHPVRGSWSGPVQVAPAGDRVLSFVPYLRLSTNQAGAALLLWTRQDADGLRVGSAYRPPGGDWGPVQRLSPPGVSASAAIGFVRPDGRAVVVWRARTPHGPVLQLRMLRP